MGLLDVVLGLGAVGVGILAEHGQGALVLTPFQQLEIDDEKTIHFAAVFPLFDEEMQLKLENGTEILFERLVKHKVTELADVQRQNVALSDFGSLD